jgi:putative transposase
MLSVVPDDAAQAELRLELDELFREGARRMLAVALEAEVQAYIAARAELVDEHGHRLVVRNGHAPARSITTGVGQVEVVRRGWTTGGSTPPAASGCSSTA